MMRLALILCVLSAPVAAQVLPTPRPDGLAERSEAAAEAAAAALEQSPGAPDALAETVAEVPQVETPDRAAIGAQIGDAIQACWNPSGSSSEAQAVRILVGFETTPDGEVIRDSIEMMEFSGGPENAAEEAMAAASRAITRCASNGLNLPPDTYPVWQRIELTFESLEGGMR